MPTEPIFSISEINEAAKILLEQRFSSILLEGEISNFSYPSSGHWYFTLKDDKAQIRCAMFRAYNNMSSFYPKDGMQVVVRAKISLYTQRGEYQLIVSQIEEAGTGALQKRFEQLKDSLLKAGLFDAEHKKPLPRYPQKIGIITSITGAAIKDVLTVLKRRYPIATVFIYPTLVQGNDAAKNIVEMIQRADQEKVCDVLLLTRGGGSLEDLWCFNEESVAQAIFACDVPIMTGIGHEIDFTIADFVADVRAPTPSAAAEMLVPDQVELLASLAQYSKHVRQALNALLQNHALTLSHYAYRLQQQHPKTKLSLQQQTLKQHEERLRLFLDHYVTNKKNMLHSLAKQLHQLSPLNTMERGYAILFQGNKVISSVKAIQAGDELQAQMKDGVIHCHVLKSSDTK